MKKLLIVAVSAIVLSGCITTNQQGGTLIGAATGGLLGSQIGSGTGKLVATGLGVLAGAMTGQAVGQHMDKPPVVVYQSGVTPLNAVASGPCSNITNSGVRSSCERGHADKRREVQRAAERRAYKCSRYRKCW